MSKQFEKLEETLDLPSLSKALDNRENCNEPTTEEVQQALQQAHDLENQLQKIDGYDQHDEEMDELAQMAIQAHKDLQDLGMNVEIRHAGEIFSSSSQMLKIAVDAKNLKVEKKLRLMRLQLDKLRIDRMSKEDDDNTITGQVTRIDRTELLKMLKDLPTSDK